MTQEELITYCRYYKGEKESPYGRKGDEPIDDDRQNKDMLWFYELCGTNCILKGDTYEEYITDYTRVGLGEFCADDGRPLSLKALLFNRFAKMHQSLRDAAEPFKKFYKRYYS